MSRPNQQPAASSSSYKNPSFEEGDDDDDLDDLDDVLASFNKDASHPKATSSSTSQSALPAGSLPAAVVDDADFEASLMEGMESLLRQLAGDHPPGPMPDAKDNSGPNNAINGNFSPPGLGGLSKEEEEKAWQKALEMVLSGEGLAAMGLDEKQEHGSKPLQPAPSPNGIAQKTTTPQAGPSNPKPPAPHPQLQSFEETMRRTLDSLNSGGQAKSSTKGDQPDLASLLASLGGDPDLLKNLNLDGLGAGAGGGDRGEDGEDGLADVLEGMMAQLMTREVLEEPMTELASKYPPYLASPPPSTTPADLDKYRQQHELVQQIVQTFKKPGYSDEKDGSEVARLVGEMQDLGGPPKEVMGDLPEGFDLGALGGGGDEGCAIM